MTTTDKSSSVDFNYVQSDEVADFVAWTEAYESGQISADEYRAYRLTRGVYGQRQDGVFMMRVKIPGGLLSPKQARRLAELLDESKLGFGNVTTRSNIQIHHVPPQTVPLWKARLNDAGISQIDACGNAVRTVTQDCFAGLAPDEVFDTTPYMQAITRFFLDHPRAQLMPRKFKIAISTSMADRGLTAIHDVGLIAVRGSNDEPAFRVAVGGGLAAMPQNALVLHEAWPAADILTPILAAIDLFQDHGNRRVRSKARIKHVLRRLRAEKFTALYQQYLEKVCQEPPPRVQADTPVWQHSPWQFKAPPYQAPGYDLWVRSSVRPTRLNERVFVMMRLNNGGRIYGEQLRNLADLAERYGDGVVTLTVHQNALLRSVKVQDLPELFDQLQKYNLAHPGALWAGNVTSCPGTSTCNLGLTHSRNLAEKLQSVLEVREDQDIKIKISGCHNSCGQHHIGTIGFYGAVKRIGGRAAPHYRLLVGGGVDEQGAQFGTVCDLVPARRAPEVLRRLLQWADEHKGPGQSTGDALRNADKRQLRPLLADLTTITEDNATEEDFIDIGLDEAFHVVKRTGECAA